MNINETEPYEFNFVAGDLSLDFTNTVDNRRSNSLKEDTLKDYSTLLEWSRLAGLLSDQQFDSLMVEVQRRPEEAQAVLERARALREAIYRIILASFTQELVQITDLSLLNAELAGGLPNYRLEAEDGGYTWKWEYPENALDVMLGPAAQSAARLLTSPDFELVRECAGDDCGWLFLDRTRNHSRRWCDMKGCGNLAKVHSYRSRKKSAL